MSKERGHPNTIEVNLYLFRYNDNWSHDTTVIMNYITTLSNGVGEKDIGFIFVAKTGEKERKKKSAINKMQYVV